MQEVQRMHEAAGGKPVSNRMQWMYSSGKSDSTGFGVSEEMEGYLLGKRRIDTLLKQKNDEAEQARKTHAEKTSATGNVGTARDMAAKLRDDPMLAIKKNEQASFDAMVNDPTMRRRLLQTAGVDERKEHKHRHRRRGDDDREGHRGKRRRSDDPDGERRHRHQHRRHRRRHSSTPPRPTSPDYSRRRGGGSSAESGRHRDGRHTDRGRGSSTSSTSSLSRSPLRHRDHSRSRQRSHSPYRRRRYSDDRSRSPRRSPSPRRRRSSPPRHRVNRNSGWSSFSRQEAPTRADEQKDQDRAARLAAMQSDAVAMDAGRKERLQTSHAEEAAERARDDRIRSDQGRFMSSVRRQAEGMNLGESLRRKGVAA